MIVEIWGIVVRKPWSRVSIVPVLPTEFIQPLSRRVVIAQAVRHSPDSVMVYCSFWEFVDYCVLPNVVSCLRSACCRWQCNLSACRFRSTQGDLHLRPKDRPKNPHAESSYIVMFIFVCCKMQVSYRRVALTGCCHTNCGYAFEQ